LTHAAGGPRSSTNDGSGSGRLARELYGLEAAARALPGEYDDNFHLTSADGHAFVLKVMHPARERSFIDLQCRALTHLAQRAPQLPLPRVTANRNREPFSSITCGGRLDAPRLAAYLCEWNSSRRSPPAYAGASRRSRPVSRRDGRGAAIVRARGGASRTEVGFFACWWDQGPYQGYRPIRSAARWWKSF